MLSNSCKYGIRAITYIASKHEKPGNTGLKEIASALNLPTPFLAKILQLLVKRKILVSAKGPRGGFILQKSPSEISLYDIVEAIDGNDLFVNCVMLNKTCKCSDKEKSPCLLHGEYIKIRADLVSLFRGRTIANVVDSVRNSEDIEI